MSEKVLVSPTELSSLLKTEKVVMIDTRDPATYAAGHITGAVNGRRCPRSRGRSRAP
jgi:thiosulfate/3-mercaptopyruvate sulfurtransferase